MDGNLIPNYTESGSLEIKIENKAKTIEFNENIIPKKNSSMIISHSFCFKKFVSIHFFWI